MGSLEGHELGLWTAKHGSKPLRFCPDDAPTSRPVFTSTAGVADRRTGHRGDERRRLACSS